MVSVISPTDQWSGRAARNVRSMPAVLCFEQNAEKTVATLNEFARRMRVQTRGARSYAVHSKHRRGRLPWIPPYSSFETLKAITPAAALVLAAEFERVAKLGGLKPFVANIHLWQRRVVDALWEIGFFDIVGFPTTAPEPKPAGEEVIVRMRSGDTADSPQVATLTETLRGLYPGDNEPTDALVHLYGAMIEAIVNVVRHAYPPGGTQWGIPSGMWWMTGAVNKRERWMTAVVYDQGVTFPVTLPNWRHYAGWKHRIAAMLGKTPAASDMSSDGQVIVTAMEEALSSTEEPHRGNGLAQMRDFVEQCREGHLRIISRCGHVVFRPRQQPEVNTHAVPVRGTLIEWRVLL